DVELATEYSTSSSLENQLSQVAKLIRVHEVRKAERDFFFVRIGGWDMHSNLLSGLTSRFGEINRALRGFVAEMKAQNMWDNVVLASSSEFARTLDSNGGGSDHAWAGQQFILGGKVKGGQILNQFPSSLKEGAYNDLGRGRLIPAYPWEAMLKPIAEWMGLDTSSQETLDAVFPNIGRFNSSIVPGEAYIFQP
ncbi:PARC, partial [Symbiodinium sp. CCMP2592]